MIENELELLHNQVNKYEQLVVDSQMELWGSPENDKQRARLETARMRIEGSEEYIQLVKAHLGELQLHYQTLHRELRVPLSISSPKVDIFIDPIMNEDYPFSDENTIVVPNPKAIAEKYGNSEGESLKALISVRLSILVFDKAINHREINPIWRATTTALNAHMRLVEGPNRNWRSEPVRLAQRYLAQRRSIVQVYNVAAYSNSWSNETTTPISSSFEIAMPLAEYIVETYGYVVIPSLLDAFEEYDEWASLVPAVFHVSSSQFEEEWHEYLRKHYPQPTPNP